MILVVIPFIIDYVYVIGQFYHNYIRRHEALDGKIPAEVTGVKIEGENRWMTVIQNAVSTERWAFDSRM